MKNLYELKTANEVVQMFKDGVCSKDGAIFYATEKKLFLQTKSEFWRASLWEKAIDQIKELSQAAAPLAAPVKQDKPKQKQREKTYKTLVKYAKKRGGNDIILIDDYNIKYANYDYDITTQADIDASGLYTALHVDAGQYGEQAEHEGNYIDLMPRIDKEKEVCEFSISADDMAYVSKAMSKEEVRYYLNGIAIDILNNRAVATDGHRLHSVNDIEFNMINGLSEQCGSIPIIPRDTILIALDCAKEHKQTNIKIMIYENGVTIKAGRYTINSKTIDATFPQYEKIIPSDDLERHAVKFEFDLPQLKKLAKLSVFKNIPIFKYNGFTDDDGEPYETGFNAIYLNEGLKEGIARQDGRDAPIRIESGKKTCVIMPAKV